MHNGKHIKVQVYGAPFEILKSVIVAERFLLAVVEAARMRPLDQPWVYDIRKELESDGEEPDPKEPEGVTGIVVLSTSHAAVHTWPHRGYAVIDLYSCTDFETKAVLFAVEKEYGSRHIKATDLSHSLDMPELLEER